MADSYLPGPAITAAAAACEDAGNAITARFRGDDVVEEDDFTSALAQGIIDRLGQLNLGGVEWRAQKLTSRRKSSEEGRVGADLLGILEVDLPKIKLRKGFLAQAKLQNKHKMPYLREQCRKMLEVSPASFIFVYGKTEVLVYPAIAFATGHLPFSAVEPWTLGRFFEAHFGSFVGDQRLGVSRGKRVVPQELVTPRTTLVVSARPSDHAAAEGVER